MTTTSRAGIGAAVLTLSGLALIGLQAPASAAGPTGAAGDPGASCPTNQHYPPDGDGCVANGLRLSHVKIRPGKTEVVAVLGFRTASLVTVSFDGTPVGTARMTGHQWAKVVFKIPANATPGDHTIAATGEAQNGTVTTLSVTVTVYLPKGTSSPAAGAVASQSSSTAAAGVTDLNATKASAETPAGQSGLELAGLAAAGVLLMGAGPTAVYAARRRRS